MSATAAGYRVLARKYRPKDFSGLIGQEALVRTLTNAFATGRIAQAYMLTGVRGVGKTTTARLIARALNYPPGPSIDMPELTASCEAILESRHMDVIEMDAASNTGVDNMREIIDSVRYAPVSVRTKVYIIDEVHMLSKSAFNALLKTLEEPPPHVKFIFATTEIRKVPVTILSRCQRFDLRRLDAALLVAHYGRIVKLENAEAEEEALRMIARAAEGSVRDGLSLLDQAIAYGDGKVKAEDVAAMLGIIDRTQVIALFDAVISGDTARALRELAAQYDAGGDPQTILTDMADFVHWVTRLRLVRETALMDGARTEMEKKRGVEYAEKLGIPALSRAWQMLLKGIAETAGAAQPMQAAEMVLIRLAHALDMPSSEELAKIAGRSTPAGSISSARPIAIRNENPPPAAIGNLAPARDVDVPPPPQTPAVPDKSQAAVTSFADIVALVSERRDIKLKAELERFVRPIAVSAGKIELALEVNAPQGLPGELSRKLEAWTGRRWMVMVAREGGAEPITRQRRDAEALAFQEARQLPTVQAILKMFPGSEVVNVRDPEAPLSTEEHDEESR